MSFYDDYEKTVRPELIKEGRLREEKSEEIDTNADHSGAKPEPETKTETETETKTETETETKTEGGND